jgi:hypothetical protein
LRGPVLRIEAAAFTSCVRPVGYRRTHRTTAYRNPPGAGRRLRSGLKKATVRSVDGGCVPYLRLRRRLAPFPLTPALSRREREPERPSP